MQGLRIISIVVLLGVFTCGCGLFSTRSAEQPDANRELCEPPREPKDVLVNMSNALFSRDAVCYLQSFNTADFTFEADNVALANDPTLAPWHYEHEVGHITSLLNEGSLPSDSLLFVIFASPTQTILHDSAEVLTPYELTAGIAISGAPRRMAGTAHFYLRMGSEGYWQIYRWVDSRTQEQNTWSDLKSLVR